MMGMAQIVSAWTMIHQHLHKEIQRVHDEIRNYPAPIPACDAQFNFLLEERESLSSELARVRKFMGQDTDPEIARSSIDAFLNSSSHLGDTARTEIRAIVYNDNR